MAATSSTEESDLDLDLALAVELLSAPRVEYACARRLRHRMLLSYLSQEGFHPTFQSLVRQTDAHLCLEHLRRLVAEGLWGEALNYLGRFLPPGVSDDIEARPILLFLHSLWALANISSSARNQAVTPDMHRHDFTVCLTVSRNFNLRSILNLMLHSQKFSANLNWAVIRNKAASVACDLAHESPELSRRVLLPTDPATPQEMVPICPRRRRYVKPPPGRPSAHAITKLYLNKRRSLPSSNPQPGAKVDTQSLNQVADLIMECFNASVSLKLVPSSKKQDGLVAPFLKTKISSLTDPATNIGTSSVPNAGEPVSRPAKTSGILSAKVGGTVNTFQGTIMRKHPRTELSTVQEEPDMKRKRTCIKLY
uniref:Uncharacterized protein n=1 Tax=Avena sativa TaxID=4498 RepID=A0ACD5Y9E5_AVESA